MSTSLLGGQIDPKPPTNIFDLYSREPDATGGTFLNAVSNGSMDYGAQQLRGVPGYGGPTAPDPNQSINQNVYNNWQPWNAGTGYMANFLSNGAGQPNQNTQTMQSNMQQYGGIGGYPTELMHSMAQQGGTGGPGNQAMANLMQYGAPSAAGQPIADMAKTGTSGTWGDQLKLMAGGGASGASQYLAPFMMAKPYNSRRGA